MTTRVHRMGSRYQEEARHRDKGGDIYEAEVAGVDTREVGMLRVIDLSKTLFPRVSRCYSHRLDVNKVALVLFRIFSPE